MTLAQLRHPDTQVRRDAICQSLRHYVGSLRYPVPSFFRALGTIYDPRVAEAGGPYQPLRLKKPRLSLGFGQNLEFRNQALHVPQRILISRRLYDRRDCAQLREAKASARASQRLADIPSSIACLDVTGLEIPT